MRSAYSFINIFDSFKSKYNEFMKPGIISISVVELENDVCLEYIETEVIPGGLEKHTVNRISLDLINKSGEEDGVYFDLKDPLETNAVKFIDEFSPYAISVTTGLFQAEACEKILETRHVTEKA